MLLLLPTGTLSLALMEARYALQTKERRAGAEDVVSAREQEGADGAAGRTDEAAQGDKLSGSPFVFSLLHCHTQDGSDLPHLFVSDLAVTSLTFPSNISSFIVLPFVALTLSDNFPSILFLTSCFRPCCGPVG